MNDDVKMRLYVTAIVIVMVTLYVGPLLVHSQFEEVKNALLQSCLKESPGLGVSFCWDRASSNAGFPLWKYLLPYIPAGVILWLNWLIKPSLRLTEESYPKRTMSVLLWFGLLVAAAVGIWIPISEVISQEAADLYKIESRTFWRGPWVAAAWLIAPILFHHLIAPVSLAGRMRKGKLALWLLTATPIVAYVLYLIREAIRNAGS